ncbi:MAG: sensor histidine kinase [Candidatus Thiodiazotropha sp. LLP2]
MEIDSTCNIDGNVNNLPHDLVDNYDRVVILDISLDRIVWISNMFKETFHFLKVGQNTSSLCNAISNNRRQTSTIKSAIFDSNSNNKNKSIIKCSPYEIEIIKVESNTIVVRLNNYDNTLLANSRYLEDREKLLFTSRSITVSEMASTLVHEINQPIGTINNLLFGLKSRLSKNDNIEHDVILAIDKSLEQVKFTSSIVSRIRDYTQTRQPKLSAVRVKALIEKCVSLMDWEMRNTNVDISQSVSLCNTTVYGDELMLQQVIINLIRNGIDSNNESQNNNLIAINAVMIDDYIQISIQDNGKGMTDQEADNIFIPFASKKSSGMGIGLNICRSFIELHKGKLWLSTNEDAGCTSHILLPLMD